MLPKFSLGRKETQSRTIRHFNDAAGLEWTVYDVVNAVAENGLPATFLCFERGVDRRRLVPIPDDWKECGEADLRRYLGRARGVHRSFASPDQFRDRR